MQEGIIRQLSKETIDKIAAGEVVERPSSVVKELVENSIDAGADVITVAIRGGGIDEIRVTDNGCGIAACDLKAAFLRHATSKLKSDDELTGISTLGFRGEALSSISAVSKVELVTKTLSEAVGSHYVKNGDEEPLIDEIAAPVGLSIFVRNLFYNVPARRKFLKSPMTEGNYIAELMERLALSHPDIAFTFLSNGAKKLETRGDGDVRNTIYSVYGRQVISSILPIDVTRDGITLKGYIGEPSFNRGNRGFETFFVNNRYVRDDKLFRALEDGYHGFLLGHQFPFAVLHLSFSDDEVDVNVHPAKLFVRFYRADDICELIRSAVSERLNNREDIANIPLVKESVVEEKTPVTEPFETERLAELRESIRNDIKDDTPYSIQYPKSTEPPHQYSFISYEAKRGHRIIGQIFDTYWLIEYDDALYIIDQHAAHEKVLYERTMKRIRESQTDMQLLSPPVIVTLTAAESEALVKYAELFKKMGFSASHFEGREYTLDAIPANGLKVDAKEFFLGAVGACAEGHETASEDIMLDRVATMSCKAAIKGHDHISFAEAEALIDELLTLDNPYHCPHGRPTIISLSRSELEKRFERIV